MLISKYLLFIKAYNDVYGDCIWETSTLRKYLYNEFYRHAFNEVERKKIKEALVENPDNTRYGTNGGNDTRDKVFLLSIDEANKYFKMDEERAATLKNKKFDSYWLRTPGGVTNNVVYINNAACVSSEGDIYENGIAVDLSIIGVRPAIWVSL